MRRRRGLSGSLSTAAAVASLLVGAVAGPAPVGAAAARTTCNLVPELRSVTINQGVGSYAVLARGKETLVRFFLSMPTCAASGNTIALTGGTLTVKTGTLTLGTIAAPTPVPSQTAPPLITPAGSAAAADSTADPKFVVPAGVLAPATIAGRFTATFTGTINWQSQLSRSATPVPGSTTFSTLTGSTAPLTAQVEQRSNALRILVVPMGNGRDSFANQFPAEATTAVQNAMSTLSRAWPVPTGVGDLGAATGGIRYTINPSLLDVGAVLNALVPDTTGPLGVKFCGRTSNFDAFKGLLAQTLLTWNTANPTKTADIVMGAVWSGASLGSNSGCAEGMASVNSPQAWIRAIPATTTAQSMSGALASMEIAHTLGVVPTTRSGANDPYHSPNQTADGTAPGRGYNVSLRSYLADDRTLMLLSGAWNNDTTTFEPADFAMLLCRLGGQTTQDCATTGTTGTATGVGAGPRLVISGTTDLTVAGTHVVESYFSNDVAPGGADAASPLRLVQVNGSRTLSNLGLSLSALDSDHDAAGRTAGTNIRVFTASVPFDTGSTDVRLFNGTTVLYSRARGAPVPVSTSVTNVGGASRNLTNDPAVDDVHPSVSPDGAWMAWAAACSKPPGPDCTADFAPRIFVAPVTDLTKTVEVPPLVAGDDRFYADPALGPRDGAGKYPLAFQVGGDLYTLKLIPGASPTFSSPVLVSAGAPSVSDPTWSPDGARLAFADGGNVYIVANSASATRTQLTTTGDASSPSWSRTPGDPRIVYVRSNPSEVGFALAHVQLPPVGPVQGGPDLPDPSGTAGTGQPDVDVSVTGGPEPVRSGEDLTQVVTLHNVGDATATDVNVSTELAFGGHVTSTSGNSGTCSPNGVDVTCPVADIAAGASRVVTFVVTNSVPGAFTNQFFANATGDSNADNDSASYDGTVTGPCSSGFSCLWTIDPTAEDPSTTRDLLVDDADNPSWGTDGRIAFERVDPFVSGSPQTQRIWTIPSSGPASSATAITAGSFDRTPSMASTTVLFGRDVQTGPSEFHIDVFAIDVGAPKQLVEAKFRAPTGFDPNLLRADLLLDCGVANGPIYVVAVGVVPSAVDADIATFSTAFDPGLSCAGGTILVVVTAGIDRSAVRAAGSTGTVVSADKRPVAAVSGPPLGSTRLQYNIIPLRGAGKDAEEGELVGGNLTWTLTGPGGPVTLATSTGSAIDVPVPPAGWTPGSYTATVTAHDSLATGTATTTFTILGDADNDGVAAPFDKVSCLTGAASLDNDPSNAFGDLDNDGIPNQADPEPCRAPDAATFAYTADTNFDPSTLNIPSTGNTVTVYVSIRGRDMRQIKLSTIRLDRIAGADPTSSLDSPGCARFGSFVATAYTATAAQGVAKFDRQQLIGYLTCRHIMFRQIDLRIVGSSTGVTPAWRFTGIGVTNVMPG